MPSIEQCSIPWKKGKRKISATFDVRGFAVEQAANHGRRPFPQHYPNRQKP
jgi:hypothetical protein